MARGTRPRELGSAAGVAGLKRMEPRNMDEKDGHYDTTRVRAGATPHMTRYILPISLGLVVVLFLLLLIVWH